MLYHFYQTTEANPAAVEAALPNLLEELHPQRVVVCCPNPQRLERLNEALWAYNAASFLPHGVAADGPPQNQPIFLAEQPTSANGANILVLLGQGQTPPLAEGFSHVIDLFDASDPQKNLGRQRWKTLKEAGTTPAYFTQNGKKWEQKA